MDLDANFRNKIYEMKYLTGDTGKNRYNQSKKMLNLIFTLHKTLRTSETLWKDQKYRVIGMQGVGGHQVKDIENIFNKITRENYPNLKR